MKSWELFMSGASVQVQSWILSFKCPDRLGVVASYSTLFLECGAFITEVSNYSDPVTGSFFLRCVFDVREMTISPEEFASRFAQLEEAMQMEYTLRPSESLPRVLLAVSKYDHCLNALLTKWRAGALPANIVGVLSNHEDCRGIVEWYGLPYHPLPITPQTKPQQEARILAIMEQQQVDLLVLARYMQILSDDLCKQLQGRVNQSSSLLSTRVQRCPAIPPGLRPRGQGDWCYCPLCDQRSG